MIYCTSVEVWNRIHLTLKIFSVLPRGGFPHYPKNWLVPTHFPTLCCPKKPHQLTKNGKPFITDSLLWFGMIVATENCKQTSIWWMITDPLHISRSTATVSWNWGARWWLFVHFIYLAFFRSSINFYFVLYVTWPFWSRTTDYFEQFLKWRVCKWTIEFRVYLFIGLRFNNT